MRKRRELAPPKLPLVSKFISPRLMLEKFSGKKTPLWTAPMRSKNQKVLSAEEAKTMPSTSVDQEQAMPREGNLRLSTVFGTAKILRSHFAESER
jgi:hypothetical protein